MRAGRRRRDGVKRIVIAIDGPAGSGKSTTARLVAERLGYRYLDTGAMYRALALKCLEESIPLDEEGRAGLAAEEMQLSFTREAEGQRVLLAGVDVTERIREHEISDASSKIAVVPAVRAALVAKQQEMGAGGGVVAEGRDTTTVVFPEAELKVFLDADLGVRAERRRLDLESAGVDLPISEVEEDLRARDERDSNRSESPLCLAPGAIRIDTSSMSVDEQVEAVLAKALELTKGGAQK